jgi:hypothetical protein
LFRRDPALLGCARHRGAGRGLGLEPPGATAGDADGRAIHAAASDDDAMCFRRRPGRARWSGSLREEILPKSRMLKARFFHCPRRGRHHVRRG